MNSNEIGLTTDWQVIQELFADVADLNEASAAEYWRAKQAPAHYRAIVESLLVHDRAMPRIECDNVSQESIAALEGQSDPALDLSNPNSKVHRLLFSPGTIINGIELLFPVAQTQMSEVWCAQSSDHSCRVAVKFLRESNEAQSQVKRFAREIEMLKRLKHPNIATILDVGMAPAGYPFFVMQWIDGLPITDFCDQHQLTIKQRIDLVCTLCEVIDYAHKFFIVHRDLKPDNVLITDDGDLFVLDFGIAAIISGTSSDSDNDDADQHAVEFERQLTPAYAAPEQFYNGPVTTSTDVHGIGVLLYQLVCGHHPFSDVAQSAELPMRDRIESRVPVSPSKIVATESVSLGSNGDQTNRKNAQLIAGFRKSTPKQLRRDLRGKLDLICAAALLKDPGERIANPAELRSELSNWLQNRPLILQASGGFLSRCLHRYPARFAIASAVLAALVSALVIWGSASRFYQTDRTQLQKLIKENESAQQNLADLRNSAARSRQKNELLTSALARVAGDDSSVSFAAQDGEGNLISNSLAIKTIRTLAINGDYADALALVDQMPQLKQVGEFRDTDIHDRVLFADTLQRLGRTTAAMTMISDVLRTPETILPRLTQQQQRFTKNTVIRLLLAAGWAREAADWSARYPNKDNSESEITLEDRLLGLEILVALKEFDAAAESLTAFDAFAQSKLLDADQQLQRRLLGVEIMMGNGQFDEAKEEVNAFPALPSNQLIPSINLLRLRAALESKPAEKALHLQRALDLLAQSDMPHHSISILCMNELAEAVVGDQTSEETWRWTDKAWDLVESTGEFGMLAAFETLEARARIDSGEAEENVIAILTQSRRLDSFRFLLSKNPYLEKSYAEALLELALARNGKAELSQQRIKVAARESENLLAAVQTIGSDQTIDQIFAYSAMLESKLLAGASDADEVKVKLRQVIEKELTLKKHPARMFLELALAAMDRDDLGSPFVWVKKYQNSHNAEIEEQKRIIVYAAQHSQSNAQQPEAEFLADQFLKEFANSDDHLELQFDAAEVISRLPNPSEGSTELLSQVIGLLRATKDQQWLDQLPALELNIAFYSGNGDAAVLAKQLLESNPDSQTIRDAVWRISQSLKLSGDKRYSDWRSLE